MTQENGIREEEDLEGQSEPQTVEIPDATDHDLDTFIETSQKLEQEKEEAPEKAPPEPEKPTTVESTPQTPQSQETPRTSYTAEEYQALQQKYEKQRLEGEKRELFLQRQNNQVGNLRKEVREKDSRLGELEARLNERIAENQHSNPAQAFKDMQQLEQVQQARQGLQEEDQAIEQEFETDQILTRHFDDVTPELFHKMAYVLKVDGIPDEVIGSFLENPKRFARAETLVQFGKRFQDVQEKEQYRKDAQELANVAKRLIEENKQLRAKPGQVVQNLQRNLNQPPPLTSATGSSSRDTRRVKSFDNMSDAELNDFINSSAG